MKYKYSDIFGGECTAIEYYNQFENTASLFQVGKKFVQHPETWQETIHTVIFFNDDVVVTESHFMDSKSNELFHAKGFKTGWKYSDCRGSYRLQNIKGEG